MYVCIHMYVLEYVCLVDYALDSKCQYFDAPILTCNNQ